MRSVSQVKDFIEKNVDPKNQENQMVVEVGGRLFTVKTVTTRNVSQYSQIEHPDRHKHDNVTILTLGCEYYGMGGN